MEPTNLANNFEFEIEETWKPKLDNECQIGIAGSEHVKALEEELAGVKGDRDAQAKKVLEAREEAEFTLLQLHQVQGELEDYSCISRKKDKLLEKYKVQQQRAKEMLSICLSKSTAKLADHL